MNTNLKTLGRRLALYAWGSAALAATVALALEPRGDSTATPRPKPVSVSVDDKPVDRGGRFSASFAPVVKKVSPSVVRVNTSAKVRSPWGDGPGADDPLRWFFNPNRRGGGPGREAPALRQQGIGSGVIVSKDGYILTNNHVVDGADHVKVALQDGREFDAKVVGKDPKTDVAVLKVDAKDLPFIEMTDSDKIEVGDLALAIGNPFGIGQTVTMGMISAKGRGNVGLDYEDFIQTDAAINPGNSGGALVDSEGRLIGINTAIVSRSGGNQGIGFAIPTNLARYVMDSLVKDGQVTRGYLGVLIQDVTPALATKFGLKDNAGALVGDLTPKGPAEKAGMQSGDVIVEFDGKPVADSRHLRLQVAQTKPGSEVPVKILRDGNSKTLEVTLKELPGTERLAGNNRTPAGNSDTLHGVTVGDIEPAARSQFGLPSNVKGALVTDVEPESPSAQAGLRPGDVIVEINREPVRNAEEAVRLTENPKDRTTLLRVWREGNNRWVVVDESKAG
jgi:serine protease Do